MKQDQTGFQKVAHALQYPFLAIGFILFVTLALNASTHLRDPAMVKGQKAQPWQAPVVYAEPNTYASVAYPEQLSRLALPAPEPNPSQQKHAEGEKSVQERKDNTPKTQHQAFTAPGKGIAEARVKANSARP